MKNLKINYENFKGGGLKLFTFCMLLSVLMANSIRSNAQCAELSFGTIEDDCGCFEVEVLISGVPGNGKIKGLNLYVEIDNAGGVNWYEDFIFNSFHSSIDDTYLNVTYTTPERCTISYFNPNTPSSATPNGVLFSVKYCGEPEVVNDIIITTGVLYSLGYLDINNFYQSCQFDFPSPIENENEGHRISGFVERFNGNCTGGSDSGLPVVDVILDDECNEFTPPLQYTGLTALDGEFQIFGFDNGSYRLTLHKDDNRLCGLTADDVYITRQHILTNIYFTAYWQFLAADMNLDFLISTMDLMIISGVIAESISLVQVWRFVPYSEYSQINNLQDNYYPAVDEYLLFDPLVSNANEDWVGVKKGDVNYSCTSCDMDDPLQDGGIDNRMSLPQVNYYLSEPKFMSKDIWEIPMHIDATGNLEVLAVEMEIPNGWDVIDVTCNCPLDPALPISFKVKNGTLKIVLVLMEDFHISNTIPVLNLVVNKNGIHSANNFIKSSDKSQKVNRIYLNQVAYDIEDSNIIINDYKTDELIIYPNPANNLIYIAFDGLDISSANLKIIDHLGRTMYTEVILDSTKLLETNLNFPSGIYYVVLDNNGIQYTKKLLITK